MADWLTTWLNVSVAEASVVRLRDCLIVRKGESPRVALFAHIDTCGFTVGYGDPIQLISIGGPDFTSDTRIRILGSTDGNTGKLISVDERWTVKGLDCKPGDRLVYSAESVITKTTVKAPYLDNRAGIWAALYALQNCEQICVCFTTGEETGGSGAMICAKYIYEKLGITKTLVCDITWDTEFVHCGDGVAISRRDRWVPSQNYVNQLIGLADGSGIKYQIEIESDGGSDGGGIERSGCPIDWAFIGAPEKNPHCDNEEIDLSDLDAMGNMLVYLVDRITKA